MNKELKEELCERLRDFTIEELRTLLYYGMTEEQKAELELIKQNVTMTKDHERNDVLYFHMWSKK